MKRFGLGLLWAIGGYVVVALLGYVLIGHLSSNTHDRSVEAAMTSALVLGPLGAIVGSVVGFVRAGRGGAGSAG